MGRRDEAETLFRRAVGIWEQSGGKESRQVAVCLANYAELMRRAGRKSEAAALDERARTILAGNPGVAGLTVNIAELR